MASRTSVIELLDVHSNYLRHVDKSALENLRSLTRLNLARNLLQTLPEGIFSRNKQLTMLNIQHNPWNCDCRSHKQLLNFMNLLAEISRILDLVIYFKSCSALELLARESWNRERRCSSISSHDWITHRTPTHCSQSYTCQMSKSWAVARNLSTIVRFDDDKMFPFINCGTTRRGKERAAEVRFFRF